MKRKSRRAKDQKVSPINEDLELIEADAAAVDVGSRSHWVAVNPQRDPNPVREFGTFTTDLMSLVDWLAQCGAKSVVMEATGVYWVSLYELLEERGFKAYVVDAGTASARPLQKRRQGLSMASSTAQLWVVTGLLSAAGADPPTAQLPALAG